MTEPSLAEPSGTGRRGLPGERPVPGGGAGIRARAEELRAARVPFVSATVVRAERPTSAKAGDAALVLEDGTIDGFVGGDCARATVQLQALDALQTGEPLLLHVTPDEPGAPGPAAAGPGEQPGSLTVRNPCLSGGTLDIFLEPVLPTPLVVVHGDAPIARALVAVAEAAGWEAVPSSGADIPPGAAAVVVASHGRDEVEVLAAALAAGVPYVGLVASPRRGAAVVAGLALPGPRDAGGAASPGAGVPEEGTLPAGISTPAGLDIGARSPGEVALSILAEVVSARPRRRQDAGHASHAATRGGIDPAPPSGEPAGVRVVTDPVCGMAVAAVGSALQAEHGGERYWFCGSGCRQAFSADPDAFLVR
ncbi:MAG: XdhC family protein [Acidimicrobiales bacterium]